MGPHLCIEQMSDCGGGGAVSKFAAGDGGAGASGDGGDYCPANHPSRARIHLGRVEQRRANSPTYGAKGAGGETLVELAALGDGKGAVDNAVRYFCSRKRQVAKVGPDELREHDGLCEVDGRRFYRIADRTSCGQGRSSGKRRSCGEARGRGGSLPAADRGLYCDLQQGHSGDGLEDGSDGSEHGLEGFSDGLEEAFEEEAGGVCVAQRVVEDVRVAVVALEVGGVLDMGVGGEEAAELGAFSGLSPRYRSAWSVEDGGELVGCVRGRQRWRLSGQQQGRRFDEEGA